ncbi:ROK family protein [Runella sp.]|uniref:ROK family protein n=1 Tax=Runella sp. TaxID=1960881 RepID=UPI002601B7DF|nr:ROK family protein [Runella sp.]
MNIGIEIGGTKLQIAVGNPDTGEIETLFRFNVEKEKGAAGILEKIEETLNDLAQPSCHIGVGFGGPVNRKTGVVAASHQIGGWSGFELKKWFNLRYSADVFIENDANTAALGEAHYGSGRGFEQQLYVTLGSGVGGGMVVGGRLYYGNAPGEAEVGLMTLDRQGNTLESYCSGWALDAVIRKVLPQLPEDSALKQLAGGKNTGEAEFLHPALLKGDVVAEEILADYADTLAWGLSHCVHLFNPQVIVLGGGVSLIGEPLAEAVQRALPRHLVSAYRPGPEVRLSELKEKAVPVGALCLIHQNTEQK